MGYTARIFSGCATAPLLLGYLPDGGVYGGDQGATVRHRPLVRAILPVIIRSWRYERSYVVLDPVELFPEVPNIYDFPSVHADLVFDESRVRSYRDAINATVKEGDVVADLGAGTGLLTFLCLQAGARKVHAIERSEVIQWAKELARRNGFSERIEFHHSDARETDIGERVDVIVSELMGHVAFEEGMAETISLAKERLLAPDGRAIPQTVTLKAALVNEADLYRNYIDIWNRFEGIDYSAMRENAVRGTYVLGIEADHINSESQVVLTEKFVGAPRNLDREFTFKTWRAGEVNGLALWFDADLTDTVRLSSNPWVRTHWQQCFAPFDRSIKVESGEDLCVGIQMAFRRAPEDPFEFRVIPQTE